MSERWDFRDEPDWVLSDDVRSDRSDVMIAAETNDNGDVTLYDTGAETYMEQTERWITVESDTWLVDLEACR